MPTLRVENVPADLYAALRARARARHSSIAREIIFLLREHLPTAAAMRRRRALYQKFLHLQRAVPTAGALAPTTDDLLRESREDLDRRGE